MDYLKALGILRLVSEQKDSKARGFWRNDSFVLLSSLDEDGLAKFFLEEYKPTPIVVPWSGGDFFGVNVKGDPGPFKKTPTSTKVIESLLATKSERLENYRNCVLEVLKSMKAAGIEKKADIEGTSKKRRKSEFIATVRSRIPDQCLDWIDTAAVLEEAQAHLNILLGSGGGSEGNTHFSDNFMQNIWECLPDFATQRTKKKNLDERTRIENALFGIPISSLVAKRTASLYDSGSIGGPNAEQGFERKSYLNPWDFVLCLEGAIAFSGALTRRFGIGYPRQAAFPFQVQMTPVGYGSAVPKEVGGKEIWMPLWQNRVSLPELRVLMAEGRATYRGSQARNGLDFARAVVSLGVDRGIRSFVRYAIVKGRVGGEEKCNTACALSRCDVRLRKDVDLLQEIDPWLEAFRTAVHNEKVKKTPLRFKTALRRIEQSIFDFCQYGESSRFAKILCSLGRAERKLANAEKFREEKRIHPISGLSQDWLRAANDGSPEFELALALARMYDPASKIGPIRANLEPVTDDWKPRWAEKDRCVIWNQADLTSNLCAALERRLMDGDRAGCPNLPIASGRTARLGAVGMFLHEMTDDSRIEELLWGCILAKPPSKELDLRFASSSSSPPIPRTYALLKHLFLPGHLELERTGEEVEIRPETAVIPLLRAGRISDACDIAVRRLRAAGVIPMPHTHAGRSGRKNVWSESENSQIDGKRLAAALLIPISSQSIRTLSRMVLREQAEIPEEENNGGIV